MKKIVSLYLLLLLIAITNNASAKYLFTHYDMNDGLSQNTVLAIAQDATGFMWFGTKNGLNRFDGSFFKQYYFGANDYSLKNDYITSLCKGPGYNLWVGTDSGLFIYNTARDDFKPFDIKTDNGRKLRVLSTAS